VFQLLSGSPATAQQRRTRGQTSAPQPARQTQAPSAVAPAASRPRLVLLIVVDQFRYDYLERFGDLFVQNGLRRLMREGASWAEANYDHMPTYTAPGHATTMTGTWPAENGIIANDWYDRKAKGLVSNVSDPDDKPGKPTYQLFAGGPTERASTPRRLMASTLGDELRFATHDRAKVIGISVKDRGAILPAGRHATAAYWFSPQTGNMVSTSYYFTQLPAWVEKFNQARKADDFMGKQWTRLLGSEAEYLKRAGADAPRWEKFGNATDEAVSFPHTIAKGQPETGGIYLSLDASPFSNDLLLDFAQQTIINEGLGQDADTDVLTLSFSANDYVGHYYGPYSQEAMDITLRTDRQIAALLDFVDRRMGLQNALVAFTADHGVAPIPEHATAMGLPGGRLSSAQVLDAVKLAIRQRYDRKDNDKDSTADYILSLSNGNIFFNYDALRRDGVKNEEIERVAGDAALQVAGISRYFTRTQLQQAAIPPDDPIARRVLHGFNARSSGDVILLAEPFKYLEGTIAATHGSPYSYDTHVPLIIMGRSLAPGRYAQAATPADIAPTLAFLLGVQAPSNATGRVLTEALTPQVRAKQ
ncbi:MAG TPA: alkaline phosphatase family protein, partial [Pyrinomonadaceae bacterium]|nr:alkaline phosphatase family protein [Pyrinomonadaceae bacterium]